MKWTRVTIVWMLSFVAAGAADLRISFDKMPKGWDVKGVPGRAKAVFECGYADDTNLVLRMTSDNATATFKSGKLGVDLNKTPIMRWRWKAVTLPPGADGRTEKLDDQAIGLYISTGGMFSQKCVAYRWETDTPKGETGRAKYAMGVVSLYWVGVRNKDDDGWFVEEANVAEDFQRAFGNVPESVGLGISCNSQFTGTKAEALLDWVEFLPAEGDATATRIYAEAYGKDPEFYRFVRSLQSYELFLGKRSTLLLSADSPLFHYLAGPQPESSKPNPK